MRCCSPFFNFNDFHTWENILGKRFVEHGDSGIRLADKDVIPSHLDVETSSVTCILPMGRMKSYARTCLQM